jgi:hypothetical protein
VSNAAGLNGGWDAAALIYFVCCRVSRLERFNVTAEALAAGSGSGKVAHFEGTPIPTGVVLTAVLVFAAWHERIGEDLYGGVWDLGPWGEGGERAHQPPPRAAHVPASGVMAQARVVQSPTPPLSAHARLPAGA